MTSYTAHFKVWRGDTDSGGLRDYEVEVNDGEVVLSVVSRTRYEQPPPREHWGPPTLMSETGRGLMIVDDLSADVEVELPSTGMVVVTATLHGASPATS